MTKIKNFLIIASAAPERIGGQRAWPPGWRGLCSAHVALIERICRDVMELDLQSGDVDENRTISMLMPGRTRIVRKDGVKVVAAETSDETGHQGGL